MRTSLTYKKRANIYTNSTGSCTFNPVTLEAHSYRWWKFVAKVDGLVVFNNYNYSKSTCKHQLRVSQLLEDLGIKIDLFLSLPKGINSSSLEDMILKTEETLCDSYLRQQLKAQARYQRTKARKFKQKLEAYLENECHFRDYEIKPACQFGTINAVAVHQVVEDIEHDVQNALHNFQRDGFGSIIFYVEGV